MTRRGLFATLLAPYLARFCQKPKPLSIIEIVEQRMADAVAQMQAEMVRQMYCNGRALQVIGPYGLTEEDFDYEDEEV